MLYWKPHTLVVTQRTSVTISSEVVGYSDLVPTVSISCQMTEKTPLEALEAFGIDLAFPAFLLCDLEDADSIKVGDKGTYNSRDYRVVAGPKRMDAETITSHAMYLCERYEE